MTNSQSKEHPLFPCPCCGYVVLESRGVGQECRLCTWVDSEEQLKDPFLQSAPNGLSLWTAQRNVLHYGASQAARREQRSQVQDDDIRHPEWRPVIDKLDNFGSAAQRALLSVADYSELYYWAQSFWNSSAVTINEQSVTDLERAHSFSIFNRNQLERSQACGCFYCCAIFKSETIKEWADRGLTAICPQCSIDAVLGSVSGHPITEDFLLQMRKRWFQ